MTTRTESARAVTMRDSALTQPGKEKKGISALQSQMKKPHITTAAKKKGDWSIVQLLRAVYQRKPNLSINAIVS